MNKKQASLTAPGNPHPPVPMACGLLVPDSVFTAPGWGVPAGVLHSACPFPPLCAPHLVKGAGGCLGPAEALLVHTQRINLASGARCFACSSCSGAHQLFYCVFAARRALAVSNPNSGAFGYPLSGKRRQHL